MPAITISKCTCIKDKTVSFKERKQHADPNCLQCKGSGSYETEENRAKRAIEQRGFDEEFAKMDAMDDAGLDWHSMSDEEYQKWTMEDIEAFSRRGE